ncbi:MAG: hypothetical protein Q9Q40_09320 [Acidobacteriota bacterium]|nr:hypothetical protein [Acidobacteriota bacterium]
MEKTEASIALLDVYLHPKYFFRKNGALAPEEITLSVNGRRREILTVDQQCPSSLLSDDEGGTSYDVEQDRPYPPVSVGISNPSRFVLYLDGTQLTVSGRNSALEAAQRWIETALPHGSMVEIVVATSEFGTAIIRSFTREKELLLDALAGLGASTEWLDPDATERVLHVGSCARQGGGTSCLPDAVMEKKRQRRSLGILQEYLTRLETTPGPKTLVYFHEKSTAHPVKTFGLCSSLEDVVGNLVEELERIGGAATSAQTRIMAAYVGTLGSREHPWAINFSANLVDGTGGSYNRGSGGLKALLRDAAAVCRLTLGFRTRENERGKVLQARVTIGGKALPNLYRVAIGTGRVPAAAARNPHSDPVPAVADDLVIQVVPLEWTNGRWKIAAYLGLPRNARGEVAVDVALRLEDGSTLPSLSELEPGEYEVAAYLRSTKAERIWVARERFILPDATATTAHAFGPVILAPDRRALRYLWPRGSERQSVGYGPASSTISYGATLTAVTWLCGPRAELASIRWIASNGLPAFRVEGQVQRMEPGCTRIIDNWTVSREAFSAGRYDYVVATRVADRQVARQFSASFAVGE